MPERLYKTMHS